MQSADGSSQTNSPVVSVCPDCGRPNFSKTNWCTGCGCLLIGYDLPPSLSSTFSYYDPSPQSAYEREESNSYEENQNAALRMMTSHADQPCTSHQLAHMSVSYNPSQNFNLLSAQDPNLSYSTAFHLQNGDNTHFSSNQEACGQIGAHSVPSNLVNRQYRQRCVSGPCEGAAGYGQDLSGIMPMNSHSFSSMPSDPDLVNSFPNQLQYEGLLSNGRPFVFPFTYQSTSPFYQDYGSAVNQSIERLSNTFQGYSINNQSNFRNLPDFASSLYQQNQIPVHMRWPSADELQTTQINRPYYRNRSKFNSGNKRNGYNNNRNKQQNHRGNRHSNNSRQCSDGKKLSPNAEYSSSYCEHNDQERDANISVATIQPEPSGPEGRPGSQSSNAFTDATDECGHQSGGEQWTSLPAELWFQILELLSYQDKARLARTCWRFRLLVADTWRIIRLDRYRHLNNASLIEIGKKRPQQLHFKNCRGDNVTIKGVNQLFILCGENLQKFSFVGCSKGAFQGDMMLLVAALYCHKLTHIDASYAPSVSDQTVRAIAEAADALRSVHLNGAQKITNSAIEHLVRAHKNTLERLELFGCFRLNSKIFTTLGECQRLKALAFGFLHHLSSSGLLELVSKLPMLSSLDLRGTQKLVTDSSLSSLATKCPFLEEIVLANMSSLTKEDGVITMLTQLPRLRVLDVCGLAVIGDNTLQALAYSCPLLEELDVTCTSITEQGLRHLANGPALFLRSLRVSFCYRITSDVLEHLVKSCPRLMRLSLYGFSWVKKWDFLFDLRDGLVIQTETHSISSTKEIAELPRTLSLNS